jgi:hypothetical protein
LSKKSFPVPERAASAIIKRRTSRSVQKLERRDLRTASRPLDDARWLVSRYTALQCSHHFSLFSCCS